MGKLTKEEVIERGKKNFIQQVEITGEYKNIRTPMNIKCLECGYEWEMKPSNFIYSTDKAKNHRCPSCGVKNGKKLKCSFCGKEIYRSKYQIEKNQSGFFYCSTTCGNKHKNIIRSLNNESTSNYRLRAFNFLKHECLVCGWNEDERILEVHHIDSDRNNNDLSNLSILCPTCHRKITLGYYKLDLDNKKLIKIK